MLCVLIATLKRVYKVPPRPPPCPPPRLDPPKALIGSLKKKPVFYKEMLRWWNMIEIEDIIGADRINDIRRALWKRKAVET